MLKLLNIDSCNLPLSVKQYIKFHYKKTHVHFKRAFYLFLNSLIVSNDLVKIIELSNNMHIIKMKIEKANKLLGEAPT